MVRLPDGTQIHYWGATPMSGHWSGDKIPPKLETLTLLRVELFPTYFFFKKAREQALSRENEGAIEGQSDSNPLEAASAVVEAGRVHSRPMSELELRNRFMALPTRPFAALYASMTPFV